MSKELVISANRHETKVAILEDDQLVEVYFQRSNEYSLAGSIHKGRVTRVLPGMQSAFVDLGLDRDTFLYVSDFFEENGDDIDRVSMPEERPAKPERLPPPPPPVIEEPAAAPEPVEAAPALELAAAEAAPAAPATMPAPDRNADRSEDPAGDRDRRGRRSRRRRNRGRGFPDSKYAPANGEATGDAEPETDPPVERRAEQPVERVPERQAERQPEPEPTGGGMFAMLPGESLAKYRNAPEPEDTDEADELTAALVVAPGAEVPAPVPTPEPEILRSEPEPVAEQEPEPELTIEALETAADEEPQRADSDPEAETPYDPSPAGDEDEDREIQALILDNDGGDVEERAQTENAGAPLTANVRDQGSRYMHRTSRRTRRRPRGPGNHEGAPPPSQQAVPPSRPVPTPEPPRSEPRAEARPDTRSAPRAERSPLPSISDLLKEGQEILVQIAKEPLGQKGARITSHIALPGRYVVYMPTLDHMGVSRKIASDDERLRLKKILQKHRVGLLGGFIIRTAGEGKTEDEIGGDMTFLANLWLDIRQKAEKRPAPLLLHHDLDIVQRVLRDQLNDAFKSVWVDSEEVYESVLRFLQRFQPAMLTRVKLYTRPAPIFDAFNVTAELEKALRPKVWLKSGGYIVINQTEALVAIDVNTGKYVGKSNRLEDTIVKTNTEAVKEIVRQVRLRDLGGIIVIDFIDMDERKNRQKVMQALEDAMRLDRAPYKILQFNDFGLVAITRKRVKQSLERTLCSPCPYCEGAGSVKSVQTIIGEILQEAHKISRAVEGQDVMVRVHPDVAKVLKSNENKYLEELEEILKRPVLVSSDAALHHEKFDLA